MVLPEASGELECEAFAASEPAILAFTIHNGRDEILFDKLLSRPGEKAPVGSVVAVVEPGDPEPGDLLGADLDGSLPAQKALQVEPSLVRFRCPADLPSLERVGAPLDTVLQLGVELGH